MKVSMEVVAKIIDGHTFETADGRCIRLANAWAPEADAEGGEEAAQELGKLIAGKEVEVRAFFRDREGRHVAKVWFDGQSISLLMNRRLEALEIKGKGIPA